MISFWHRSFVYLLAVPLLALALTGCDMGRNMLKADRAADAEIQDFRDMLSPRQVEVDNAASARSAAGIPDLQPYMASPSARAKAMPLVSISVNQSVPLRDVLFELAKQADYDLELDPSIRGSIIFTARNRPFDEVVERISKISGLRYKFEDDYLRVELDTPYSKVYKVDYLNSIRTNAGSVQTNLAVVSTDEASTGSSFEATSESRSDFWGDLESSLTQIIGQNTRRGLNTSEDPRISATPTNPDVQAVAPPSPGGNVNIQPPDVSLQVDSLPIGGADGESFAQEPGSFSINRQAGLINVFATERVHEEVQDYLKLLRESVTAQVLIEARILEVALNDNFATGIDWSLIGLPNEFSSAFGRLDASSYPLVSSQIDFESGFSLAFAGNDITAAVQALSQFGTVRALASPRLTVLNNQSAVLNVSTNRVFFNLEIEEEEGDENQPGSTTVETEIRNVPEGVIINVLPSINIDDNTVSMSVRPTITRITSTKENPGVTFVLAQNDNINLDEIENAVPELSVQEIDTMVKVNSGKAVVMGGLLQDRIETDEEGIPGLSEVPMVGSLFKQHADRVQKTELVIFLKATILDSPSQSIHSTDKDLYRRFSGDRRPFKL